MCVCVCMCVWVGGWVFNFVVCCGLIHLSYIVITFTTYATRYGSLKFGLPGNRLQVLMLLILITTYTLYAHRKSVRGRGSGWDRQ